MKKSNKNLINFKLLIAITLIQLVECKRIFWPPITTKAHTYGLENSLRQHLEKGCPSKEYKLKTNQEPEHFFVVTHTQNFGLSKPTPVQFTHIPSGYQINFNNSCEDCKANEFTFDGTIYKTINFECRNLCIFTAEEIKGDCIGGRRNYRITIPFGHKHLEISETCHRVGYIGNLKYSNEVTPEMGLDLLRENEYEYIGHYSRKVFFEKNDNQKCARKCMPVCRQFTSGLGDFDTDEDFESYDRSGAVTEKVMFNNQMDDEKVNVNEYVTSFMKELCSYNRSKSSLYESYRLMDLQCNSVAMNLNSITVLLISLILVKLL